MLKKLMLMFIAVFSMVLIVNAKEVTDRLEEALNDPQTATDQQKNAEIKEIDAQEKAKEKQAKAELSDDAANVIKKEVGKEVAEDEAIGDVEGELKAEKPEAELETAPEKDDNSSWFGWLWPFGEDDDNAEIAEEENTVPAEAEKDVAVEAVPVEDIIEVTEEPVAVEDASEVTEEKPEQKVTEEAPEVKVTEEPVPEAVLENDISEPKIVEAEEDVSDVDDETEEISWFGWLWPFGGDDDDVEIAEVEEDVAVEAVPVEDIVEVTEEPVTEEAVEETPEVAVSEEPVAEEAVEEAVMEETPEPTPESVTETENVPADGGEGVDIAQKLIYYFPNLFLNLVDTFSVNLGIGAEAGARIELTRWFQIGGNKGDSYFLEKGYMRQYGGGYRYGYSFQLGPLASENSYIDNPFGNVPEYIIQQSKAVIPRTSDLVYAKNIRDFWAVGVKGGWLVNVGILLHPVELADFITGIFFFDLCDDDWQGTSAQIANDEKEAVEEAIDDQTAEPEEAVIEEEIEVDF